MYSVGFSLARSSLLGTRRFFNLGSNDSYLRSGLRRSGAVGHGHLSVPPVPSPDKIDIIDLTSDNEEDMMGYETGTGTEAEPWGGAASYPA